MDNNEMNEMFKKAQYMIQNNQIPDDIKKMVSNFQKSNTYNHNNSNGTNSNNSYSNNLNSFNNNKANNNSNQNNSIPNIDMETFMKIQNIMYKMQNSEDDDMSKLLLSLKPYLRDGRKDKVDEYIKLIKMGKMTELLNLFGNDKK